MIPFVPVLAQITIRWRLDWLSLLIGFVLGLLAFWGAQKLWPILRRWQGQVAGRVQETQQWVRSGVDSRYRGELAIYLEKYHLFGEKIPLSQVFVAPRLLAPAALTDLTQLRTNGPEQLIYLWPELANRVAIPAPPMVSLNQLLLNGQHVIVTGGPGAGKTTLLAYSAYLAAAVTETQPQAFLLKRVPLFAHLAELDLTAAATDPALPLLTVCQNRAGVLTKTGLDRFLQSSMQQGTASLFLDGWDEVVGTQREQASQWLGQLVTRYPQMQIIAAAPLRGYGPLTELGFVPTMIMPWRGGQAQTYHQKWLKAHPRQKTIGLASFWQAGQSTLETVLRHHLIWRNLDASSQRTSLLQQFGQHLNTGNEKTHTWLPEFALHVWQIMAYRLIDQGKFTLTTAEVGSLITEIAITRQLKERNLPEQWLAFSVQSGLIQQWPDNRLSFRSPLWRDYCAAAYLAQADNHTLLQEKLDHTDWREIIRLYVGLVGGEKLASSLLEQKEKPPWYDHLFQLASWIPEVKQNEEWKRSVLVQLGKMILQHELPMLLRLRAMATVAQTRDPSTMVFWQQLLQRGDPILREMAVLCLPLLGAEKVLSLWEKMRQDQVVEVRRAVIWSMAWSGETVAEKPLLLALVGHDEHLHRTVAEALAWNGGESWDILREALQENAAAVRRAAVWGLSLLDEPWVIELFAQVEQQDDEWIVRTAAKEARQDLLNQQQPQPWPALQADESPWLVQWAAQQNRGVPAGKAAVAVMLEVLRQGEKSSVRSAAAITFGHMSAKEAVGPLQTALRDPNNEVVEAAFAALGQIRRVYGGSDQ